MSSRFPVRGQTAIEIPLLDEPFDRYGFELLSANTLTIGRQMIRSNIAKRYSVFFAIAGRRNVNRRIHTRRVDIESS
jgi:hypothetical protein